MNKLILQATRKERPRMLTLKARTAEELMTRQVISIPESAPLREAVTTLVDRGFSGAPVIDDAGRAVGVISLSDIVVHDRNRVDYVRPAPEYYLSADLRAQLDADASAFPATADRTRVGDVMTSVVFSVRPDAPARQVIEELLHLRVHRLFVIDAAGVLVGVIATSDVLRHLIDSSRDEEKVCDDRLGDAPRPGRHL
jgi:CBS-domain-containing membrane protein